MNKKLLWFNLLSGGGADAGLQFLQENALQYFDFTALSGNENDVVAAVSDLSPNGRNLESQGSPVIKLKQIGDTAYKTVETYTDTVPTRRYLRFDNAAYGEQMFRSSFEIFALFMLEDGQPDTVRTHNYFGVQTAATNRNRVWSRQTYSSPNFILSAAYTQNDATPQVASYGWNTANGNPFVNGPQGQTLLRIKFDFENDIFLMSVDGVEATYTVFVNISTVTNPTNWTANGHKFCLGLINDIGTLSSDPLQMYWLRWAITPILTPQQLSDVVNYLVL